MPEAEAAKEKKEVRPVNQFVDNGPMKITKLVELEKQEENTHRYGRMHARNYACLPAPPPSCLATRGAMHLHTHTRAWPQAAGWLLGRMATHLLSACKPASSSRSVVCLWLGPPARLHDSPPARPRTHMHASMHTLHQTCHTRLVWSPCPRPAAQPHTWPTGCRAARPPGCLHARALP